MHSGRHFLQIPGPTNVPDRVLRAMDRPVIDHRSAEFAKLGTEVLEGMRPIFQTTGPVVIYPGFGHRSVGSSDRQYAYLPAIAYCFSRRATSRNSGANSRKNLASKSNTYPATGAGAPIAAELEARLAADRDHSVKAVLVVHNETSTGVTSRIPEIRRAMNAVRSSGAADGGHDFFVRFDRLPP